jgi:hypothetical protein
MPTAPDHRRPIIDANVGRFVKRKYGGLSHRYLSVGYLLAVNESLHFPNDFAGWLGLSALCPLRSGAFTPVRRPIDRAARSLSRRAEWRQEERGMESIKEVGKLSAAFWTRNGGKAGWLKGAKEEMKDNGDNYAQMVDDEGIMAAIGLQGQHSWVGLYVTMQPDGSARFEVKHWVEGTGHEDKTAVYEGTLQPTQVPELVAQAVRQ